MKVQGNGERVGAIQRKGGLGRLWKDSRLKRLWLLVG